MHLRLNSKKQVQKSKLNKKDLFPAKIVAFNLSPETILGTEVCAYFSL